jgi:hypothetical protein
MTSSNTPLWRCKTQPLTINSSSSFSNCLSCVVFFVFMCSFPFAKEIVDLYLFVRRA